jgi:hypothetical protein
VLDVDVVAAAFGVLPAGIHAVRAAEEEKLWCCIRYARGADLEDEAERRAETPLRAVFDAIACVVTLCRLARRLDEVRDTPTRSHDFMRAWTSIFSQSQLG